MKRCKVCNKLNGDHQVTCSNCQAQLEAHKIIHPIEPKDILLSPLLPIVIICYGVIVFFITLFTLESIQFDPLLYIFIGFTMLQSIKKIHEVEERFKSLEKENNRLKKAIETLSQHVSNDI